MTRGELVDVFDDVAWRWGRALHAGLRWLAVPIELFVVASIGFVCGCFGIESWHRENKRRAAIEAQKRAALAERIAGLCGRAPACSDRDVQP